MQVIPFALNYNSANISPGRIPEERANSHECIPMFGRLATEILEPIRLQFNVPLVITSGYRSPEANAAAKGQPNSQHVASINWCACDFYPSRVVSTRTIFDWMRQNATLPYHQLIYERGKNTDVIHVSINALKHSVRSVLEGATHNAEPYTKVEHVEFAV
jgi:hypothetical protein